MSSTVYNWEYRIEMKPYDKVVEVLEAFFASYPGGDYTCEHRERYKLRFRRGTWKKSILALGELVPEKLVKGQFERWPIRVFVLVRPSPEVFLITIRYELHLPKSVNSLADAVLESVDQHARKELDDLSGYLAECAKLDAAPKVVSV